MSLALRSTRVKAQKPSGPGLGFYLKYLHSLANPEEMVLDSRITWEKVSLELELLTKEEPQCILPLLIGINCLLRGDNFQDWCSRTINFMTYELGAACEGLTEDERLNKLNEFFFESRDFRINELTRANLSDRDLFVRDVLSERGGGALPLAILYTHLAFQVDLPMMVVNIDDLCLVRWARTHNACYIDLANKGRILAEEDLLKYLNRENAVTEVNAATEKLDILSFKQVMSVYLEDLRKALMKTQEPDLIHAVLSMLLKLEPMSLKHLGDRALLRKQLGFYKESMADLKRYFSFCELSQSPIEIQKAFKEISAFQNLETPEVLH